MKQLFTILTFLLTTISYSQKVGDINNFYNGKIVNDSSFKYFISFLNKFDSTNIDCEKAAERIGDYYKFKKDYLKAIAYYDSADTKYSHYKMCGNHVLMDLIPRRYKISQCYLELNNPKQAVSILTRYIFDDFASDYFDSTMTLYYSRTLRRIYSNQEIQSEIKKSIDSAKYVTADRWSRDSSSKELFVSCKIKIFDTEIELAGFETSLENDNKIPRYLTKESFLKHFQRFKIYKELHN